MHAAGGFFENCEKSVMEGRMLGHPGICCGDDDDVEAVEVLVTSWIRGSLHFCSHQGVYVGINLFTSSDWTRVSKSLRSLCVSCAQIALASLRFMPSKRSVRSISKNEKILLKTYYTQIVQTPLSYLVNHHLNLVPLLPLLIYQNPIYWIPLTDNFPYVLIFDTFF